MKIIYRCDTWIATKRIEVENGKVSLIQKDGTNIGACGWTPVELEESCKAGRWTKAVVPGEPDYTSREYQKSVLDAAWDGVACQYRATDGAWSDPRTLGNLAGAIEIGYEVRIAPKPEPATVPLEPQDWFPLGWAVRKKPEAPLLGFLDCFPVTGISAKGIKAATKRNDNGADKGRPGFFTHSEAAELLERTRDGINFEPCYKPAK